MLDIVNKGDFHPGCIYRIELENFVTYEKAELFPGKSLNLIIGPNGTGKSTFVCAIILGLCGKPIDIGRDAKISTFIKRGYKSATIEIELYNKKGMKNIIIKRVIEKSDTSHWYINGEKVNIKKVEEKTKQFNIQVDNLCQLLPQDKVQEFSALKPTDLLVSTLKAVGKYKCLQQWENLKELKNELVNMSKNLRRDEKSLEKLKRDNESLKQKIEENKQRKLLEREIEICEKKLLWIDSQELRAEVAKYNKEKTKATSLVNSHKKTVEPLKNDLEHSKNSISQLELQKLSYSGEVQKLKDQLMKCIESLEKKQNQLKHIDTLFKEKLNNLKMKQNELKQAKMKLDKLLGDRRNMEMKVQDENNLKLEFEEILKQKQAVKDKIDKLNKHWTDKTSTLDNQIRLHQNQIRQMEDVQSNRLNILSTRKEHTYKALMWLRENRHKFKHPVYEPMMLEINFTNPIFARYLESTVPARDLIAFTFECIEDMNLFNSIIRNELKLKLVNAVNSEGGDFNIQSRNLLDLSYLGFYTCLLDTVIAPTAILRYLCTMYNIHNIPIGNQHTYMNSDKVPENINFFFSENHRFSVRVSAYGSKSSTTIEIKEPFLLANTVDSEQITTIKNELQKCQDDKKEIEDEYTAKLPDLENELKELCRRDIEKRELIDKMNFIKTHINIQTNKISALENEPKIDIEQEKALCKKNYNDCVMKQCNIHSEIFDIMHDIHNKVLRKMKICMVQIEAGRDEILKKDLNYRQLQGELNAAMTKLQEIDNNLKKKAILAKQKYNEMMQALDGKPPTHPTFRYAKEFNDLPEDREGLIEYKEERLTKISCMENVDSQTLKDYEDRSKEIERITSSLQTSNTTTTKQKELINRLKSEWLPPLEAFIEKVSAKFTQMFEKSGRAGEVILHKGNGDEDFAGYGINMMVKFRQAESLSVLTRHSQSGGERALTTAIYLLALQAHTVAPFRCVDEINQGLDAINERLMLQLLIRETTKSNSQYFILSPTLLLDLEYNEKVMVHTVMNGRHIVNYKEWSNDEFLRRAKNITN